MKNMDQDELQQRIDAFLSRKNKEVFNITKDADYSVDLDEQNDTATVSMISYSYAR